MRRCWAHATRAASGAVLAGQRRARHQRGGAEARGHEVRQIVEPRGGLAEALVALVAVSPHRVGRVDGAVRPRGRQPAHGVREDRRRDAVHEVLRRGLDRRGRDLVRRELLRGPAHQVPPDQHPRGSEVACPQRGLHAVRGLVEPAQREGGLERQRLQHDAHPAESARRGRRARARRPRRRRPPASRPPRRRRLLRPGARRSAQPSARPSQATGCQRAGGSPRARSRATARRRAAGRRSVIERGMPSRTARRTARARHQPATVPGPRYGTRGPRPVHARTTASVTVPVACTPSAVTMPASTSAPTFASVAVMTPLTAAAALERGVEHDDQVDRRRLPRRPASETPAAAGTLEPDRRDGAGADAVGLLPHDARPVGPGRRHEPDERLARCRGAARRRGGPPPGSADVVAAPRRACSPRARGVEIAADHGRGQDARAARAPQPHRRPGRRRSRRPRSRGQTSPSGQSRPSRRSELPGECPEGEV